MSELDYTSDQAFGLNSLNTLHQCFSVQFLGVPFTACFKSFPTNLLQLFSWSTVADSNQHQRLTMIRSFEIMRIGAGPPRSRIEKHCYNATSVDSIIKNCNKKMYI